MKIVIILVALFELCTVRNCISGDLYTYRQELRVHYTSVEDAQRCKFLTYPMPYGKNVAFTFRWDDTNPNDLAMSSLMYKYGYKGTFYLNKTDDYFDKNISVKIVEHGSSIGNHTLDHLSLTEVSPNEMFYQIMALRVQQECKNNLPVTAFVLPYWCMDTRFEPLTPLIIGETLKRSGHYGSGEFMPGIYAAYGLNKREWFNPCVFEIGDITPSGNKFDESVLNIIEQGKNSGNTHITMALGVHCNQTEEGMRTIEKCLRTYANNPQWWYCNMNEWISAQYQYNNTKYEVRTDGRDKVICLERPEPFETGAEIPLAYSLNPPPDRLELDGKPVPYDNELPHSSGHDIPSTIALWTDESSELNAKIKFSCNVNLSDNAFSYKISNYSNKRLSNVLIRLRLPLLWESGVLSENISEISSNQVIENTFNLGAKQPEWLKEYRCGKLYFVTQVDGQFDGIRFRRYSEISNDQMEIITPVNSAYFKEQITPISIDDAKRMSDPKYSIDSKWSPCAYTKGQRPFYISNRNRNHSELYESPNSTVDGNTQRFVATILEYNADGNKMLKLYATWCKYVYMNGEEVKPSGNRIWQGEHVHLKNGRNRILFITDGNRPTRFFAALTKYLPSHFISPAKILPVNE